MHDIHLQLLLFIIIAGFIAAFIDSVVGGGGLISIPALLFVGLPPSVALGTNKLASTVCSLTSMASFMKSGQINLKFVLKLFPLAVLGSVSGAYIVRLIPSENLKPLVLCLLIIVTIYTIFKKNWGTVSTFKGMTKKKMVIFGIVVFAIGFYDGFLGGGTGSFFLFSLLAVGFSFVEASGNAKVLNFGSNIAAVITFIALGSVNYAYGIPMALAMMAGALVGTNFAIKKGAGYVRLLFIVVTVILIGKNLWDYVGHRLFH
ncbi:TSUP family transporter [Fictibacillus sp. Mic-4]|uniref:sulfite exporter TauE/SafE family protein n=1 Tax=Fictibacillus TaxID=1329200 RepID=UPI000418F52C|nr:TSUP family transporter [Fictibacillus gelatini]